MRKKIEDIIKSLNHIGLDGEQHREFVTEKVEQGKPRIKVTAVAEKKDGNSMLAEAHFSIDQQTGKYQMEGYRVHVQQQMSFPDIVVNGIAVSALHDRMDHINWGVDFRDAYQHFFDDTIEKVKGRSPILAILKDLWKLSKNDDPAGTEIRDKLMFKFLLDTPFEKYHDLAHLKSRYSAEKTYTADYLPKLNTSYKELVVVMNKGLYVPRRSRKFSQPNTRIKGIRP